MKSALIAFCLAAAAFPSLALAAPPAAPVVTVGANDIKQLQFDWPSVPDTDTYELWFRADDGAPWVKYTESPAQRPRIRISVSVHLLDWRVARYRVAACNSSGCTNSAEVGVEDLALDAVGYLKPETSHGDWWFGHTVAMSADGKTAALVTGELLGMNSNNGAVYVYRKTSSGWRFDAHVRPSLQRGNTSQPYVGNTLALSGDGSVMVLGRFYEGIGGDSENGDVYVFRRIGDTWTQVWRVATGVSHDWFGYAVDLDDSGNTLAIWHRANSAAGSGVTEIYNHTTAGWQLKSTLPVPVPASGLTDCKSLALSGDGRTLVRTCNYDNQSYVLVHNAPGWTESARIAVGDNTQIDINGDGTVFVVRQTLGRASVYRLQQNAWTPDAGGLLWLGDGGSSDFGDQHTSISLSRDGKVIAAGNRWDSHGGFGPVYPPIATNNAGYGEGGVYVYERKTAGWRLRRLIKPSTGGYFEQFGHGVALGDNGRALIVGALEDSSAATGVNGDPTDTSAPQTGAAWLY